MSVLSTTPRRIAALALLLALIGGALLAARDTSAAASPSRSELIAARDQLLKLTRDNKLVQQNIKTFDTLDFDVFSNEKWDRLKESHSADVRVFWPDGHMTRGIERHIKDLKQLFVYAPDTRIKEHPIKFGFGNKTAVTGVFEGTFTRPMPDGKGGLIQPTGKAFKFPMATIGIWKDGVMVEEHLHWDNATFARQIGLTT